MSQSGRTGLAVVMFTDRVGSTATRVSLGDRVADALQARHDGITAQVVARHDGHIVKWLGDGMVATFGAATAAVSAAVELQRTLDRHNRRPGVSPIHVRVGISAGDVSYDATGGLDDTVNGGSFQLSATDGDVLLTGSLSAGSAAIAGADGVDTAVGGTAAFFIEGTAGSLGASGSPLQVTPGGATGGNTNTQG